MLSLLHLLSLRYLRRRPGRAALVAVSIALGVATLISSRALNRSMEAAARSAAAPLAGAADLVVNNGPAGVPRALAAELRGISGLRAVQPLVFERAPLLDLDGRIALVLGVEAAAQQSADLGAVVEVTRPTALLTPFPVLVGRDLAASLPDGPVRVRVAGQVRELARLGTVTLSGPGAELGRSLLVLDLDRAAKLFDRPLLVSRIDLFLSAGADVTAVRQAVQEIVGARAAVETPDAHGQSVQDVIAGVQTGFALCGAGALVIGLFLVYNALSVSVAERRPEIGIMRSLGATRGQVAALFAGEAVVLGLVGALLGLPLGIGLARLALGPMQQVLSEIFLAVEAQQVRWEPATLVAALTAGVLTALAAALVPALQAAADEPADAVRRTPAGSARLFRVVQGTVSLLLIAVGVAMAVGREALPLRLGSYGGLILVLLGSLLSTPLVVVAAARLVRPLVRLLGVAERLAADNLMRAPGRTGLVIGALAAGVAMTVQIAGVAASNEAPVVDWVDRSLTADLYVMGGTMSSSTSSELPLGPGLVDDLTVLPGVQTVVPVRFRRPTFRGTVVLVVAFDAAKFHAANAAVRPDYPGLDKFPLLTEPGTALVSDNFAALHGVRPGDTIALPGPRGPVSLRVAAAIEDYSWNRGVVFLDRSTLRREFEDERVDICDVFLADGPARPAAEAAVRDLAARRALFVMARADLRGYITDVIRRLYALVQVQQLVVGLVGALGVVTALLISVLQRRRELGLLRAVGATRAQVLRTVLAEAALMGLIGTLFGVAMGVPMQWYMVRVVLWEESGFLFPVIVPWRAAAGIAAVSLAVATLAGLAPALHAARLRVAEAVTFE